MIRWPFVRTAAVAVLLAGLAGCGPRAPVATVRTPVRAPAGFYAHDVIRPSVDRAVMRERLVGYYREWKAAFVRPGCGAGSLRIHSPDAAYPAVAEAQGYGMLGAASMAALDPGARELFDGILRFVLAHPSSNDADLMAAELDARCTPQHGGDSATDGDMDIAYALLLADRTWGSTGRYDYRLLAVRRIRAIRRSTVHPDSGLMLLGDWSTDGTRLYGTSRTSDWNPVYFRAFGAATGDPAWTQIAAAHRAAIDRLQRGYSPRTGLMPDFVEGAGDTVRPVTGRVLETAHDGDHGFNACRTPWRLGLDALLSGDAVSTAAARRTTRWFRSVTGDDPARVGSGYTLDGTAYRGEGDDAFWAPLAVSAMTDPDAQPWLDALWRRLAASRVDPGDYFGDTLRLQVMIIVSGNYPASD
ncbi:glycosyl hydrolase family 8 [Actinoplanes xinjiangensis]|uniref:glycosyl hydrolase family 8 n=1 Tax=Actinoplanes xinjiangensis TaxID=512350 RepID=UPI00341F3C59